MRGGAIIERGTHAGLLGLQGAYANMWRLQNEILDLTPLDQAAT